MSEKSSPSFTHFDESGNAVMVDVGQKDVTSRTALASGKITMSREAYELVKAGRIAKGDVLGLARTAGIMASKKVPDLIPLTHLLLIERVNVDFIFHDENSMIEIRAKAGVHGKTGVEMEALTAVSVAALTIYDMCKAIDKTMVIGDICLLEKTGGKSGTFLRPE